MEDVNDREKKKTKVGLSNDHEESYAVASSSSSSFKAILNQSYLRRLIFNHVNKLWGMMFSSSDGIYRANNDILPKMIATTIDYNNHQVLEYLLNRIKNEIGPFQTMVTIVYTGSEYRIEYLSLKVYNLLVDDNVFIDSNHLLHRMAKTAVSLIGDVDGIRNLFKRYNLSNLDYLFRNDEKVPAIKDLFKKKTD
ncbi:hypothetical protein DFA_10215 [Cavenderia fasciculata]|uniref:Uncharacterized protein n=1 Tax=Cavenderia fasciculata TaxID=261658 RepID=F4Q9L2_CACFS|nr:uncharacterized protein DFA_10215 [Cavenderia fasciculata]EGG15381.1 hypothetical protein DFA_10215 [Cavenderia fasciculata]|eukprot:XP_004354123.1 hypothetical protein DFA_10215 [Cavenderia fasciculata]